MKNRYSFRNVKSLWILMISLFFAGNLMSQIIVDETFNYTNGSLLTANGYTQTASSSVNLIKVDSTNLTYTGYPHSGVGKSIVIDTTGEDIYKTFTSATSGDVYVSFLVNVKKATITGDYFYCMSPNPFATTYTVRTFIKSDATGNLAFGILKGSTVANTVYTGFNYSINTTYLVVLRYSILTGATNDSISMWVNPVIGSTMPVQTISTSDNIFTDAVNIGSFVFRQGTAANAPRVQLSGFRVTSAWADLFGTVTPMVATPTFNPIAGTYTSAQTVSLSSTTSGASIYYTVDGTDPTSASTLYSTPITVSTTKTIKARGYKTGMDSSAVGTALYTINLPTTAATPTFSPVAGTYYSNQNITLSCATPSSTIYYTIDGTDPSSLSSLYSSPVSITTNKTIKARAYASGLDSSVVASAAYVLKVDTVKSSVASGTYSSTQNVSLTCSTVGANIYYTINGNTPNSTSTLYSSPIVISSSTTLKAIALKTAWDSSIVSTFTYTFVTPPVSLPFVDTFNLALNSLLTSNGYTAHSSGGTNSIKVTDNALTYQSYPKSNNGKAITIDTTGEDIHKTFLPRTSGSVYASYLVKVSKATTNGDYFFHFGQDTIGSNYKARVYAKTNTSGALSFGISKSGSSVNYTNFDYAINTTYLVVLRYAINSGATNDSVQMWINPAMANMPAYTIGAIGSDFSSADLNNVGSFAFRQGSSTSAPRVQLSGLMIDTSWTNMFAGVPQQVVSPIFSVASGTYYNNQSVTITSATTGASIYYTTDGSTPTQSSTLYSAAVSVSTPTILKAKAYKTGLDSSLMSSAAYLFKVDTVKASVPTGTYTSTQNISLSTNTVGATIYYTTNGTTPTSNSSLYSSPIVISTSTILKTIGFKTNWDSSVVNSYTYSFAVPSVNLPYIDTFNYPLNSALSVNGYTAFSSAGTNSIKVTSPALSYQSYPKSGIGNSITIDTTGEDVNKVFTPKTNGSVYASFLVNISKATTNGDYFFHFGQDTIGTTFRGRVYARTNSSGALAFGVSKSGNTVTYSSYNYSLNTPYLIVLRYSIYSGATNDSIDLWVNPNMSSIPLASVSATDINQSDLANVGSFAFRQGTSANAPRLSLSGLMVDTSWTHMFAGVPPQVVTPVFSSISGTYNNTQNVTISTSTSGASIYYTTDGTTPTQSSTIYSTPVVVSGPIVLKAKAYKTGYDSSLLATAAYLFKVDTIQSNLASGTYVGNISVTLSSNTNAASIYYTTDGTTPTQASTLYSTAINISNTTTLKARGYKTNYDSSVVSTWAYSIGAPPVSLPYIDTFNLAINSTLAANGYTAHSAAGTNSIKVSGSALVYNNYPKSNIGNAITIDTTGEDVSKRFSAVISGDVYSAFLVKVTKATTNGDYFYHLGADSMGSTYKARLYVRSNSSGALAFGLSKSGSSTNYTQYNYALNTSYLVVMRYSIVAGATNDSVDLWIDPTMATMPAPVVSCPDASSTDLNNIGTFAFRQGSGNSAPRVILSGLMIDTSWTHMFAGVPPQVATPTFTPAGGTYTSAQNVSISCATNGATVYYTTDGSIPTQQSSNLFSTPINVSATTTIKAKAYKLGMDSSSVGSAIYTISVVTPPTVTTSAASGIGKDSATLSGTITSMGGGFVTARGFVYATHANPTMSDSVVVVSGGFGSFSKKLTGLSSNTTYYFKAYATNSGGTSYGSEMSFTTLIDGIDESNTDAISIYPNPATNYLKINNAEGYTIQLHSLVGQLIKKVEVNTSNYSIDISDLPAGVYFIQFQQKESKKTYKIVVQ